MNMMPVIVPLRLPCGDAVGDTTNRVVAPSLVTHHASHLRSLRGCWIVEALKASGVTLSNLPPQMLVDVFTHAFWYLPSWLHREGWHDDLTILVPVSIPIHF